MKNEKSITVINDHSKITPIILPNIFNNFVIQNTNLANLSQKEVIILGIESSCDDTSAAVLKNNAILSNVIARQEVHELYGGVVAKHSLFEEMKNVFAEPMVVILYLLGLVALFWHLFHGFQSAFQSLGVNGRFTPAIKSFGRAFSVVVAFLFAIIPIYIHFFTK